MKTYKIDILHPFSINHISFVIGFELKNITPTWIIQLSFFQVMKYANLVDD